MDYSKVYFLFYNSEFLKIDFLVFADDLVSDL